MKRQMRASLIAAVAVSLLGSPLAAQSARQGSPPAEVKVEAARATQVLATEATARLGISRAEAPADARAAAMQQQSETTKWIIIIGISVVATLLILALAN